MVPSLSSTTQPFSQSDQNQDSDSSYLYIIIIGVLVTVLVMCLLVIMRLRKAHKPSPSSTPADTNNQITYNPTYATIEGTYSEIDPANSVYETPVRNNPADESRTTQPYAVLETSRKTYESTSQQEPKYDVATMMTSHQDFGLDSHPYDEVDEMRNSKNTSSLA
jgi:heme/copper-type cytochrome/quinol oxidase subunit 2